MLPWLSTHGWLLPEVVEVVAETCGVISIVVGRLPLGVPLPEIVNLSILLSEVPLPGISYLLPYHTERHRLELGLTGGLWCRCLSLPAELW